MAFQFLTNIPLERAKTDYSACLLEQGFHGDSETVAVPHAYGRITAQAVYAKYKLLSIL